MTRARFLVAAAAASTLAACAISFDGYELGDSSSTGTPGGSSASSAGAQGGDGASTSSSGGAGSGASGANGGTGPASGGGPSVGGGGSGSNAGGSGGSLGDCPSTGGLMVQVLGGPAPYCMDITEVTQSNYEAFLASDPDPNDQTGACTGQGFTVTCSDYNPFNHPDWPVACVDWCDATAFCKAVGKRLCGRISGGPLTPDEGNDPAESQWYRACSNNGADIYPYGNIYDLDRCAGVNAPTDGPVDVGFYPTCVNALGNKDLSGNVREWEDACDGGACRVRGGSWLDGPMSPPDTLRCDSDGTMAMTANDDEVGFRCCADL